MNASRILTLRAAIGLAAALGCCWALASDPLPSPQEIAKDTPTFRAPAEPPGKEAPEEPLVSEPVGPLALQDALALALMRNPELAVFSWETRASEARALQAKKVPNPELDVRVYRLGIPRGSIEPDDKRTRVVLSQVLELGAKRKRRFNLARTEHSLAEWDYEAKRMEVAAVVAGFADVRILRCLIRRENDGRPDPFEQLGAVHHRLVLLQRLQKRRRERRMPIFATAVFHRFEPP